MEADGCTIVFLNEEDNTAYKNANYQVEWNNSYPNALSQGIGDEFELIFDKAAEIAGGEFSKE